MNEEFFQGRYQRPRRAAPNNEWWCAFCKQWLPENAFHRLGKGRQKWCIPCKKLKR